MADKVMLTANPAYNPWTSMVSRCTKPNYTGWHKYGGAGIRVYEDWIGPAGFARFVEHIGPRPSPIYQIDRIDGLRGYVPGNVRWATPTEQNRNRKDNVILSAHGKTMTMSAWAEELGLTRQSMHKRLQKWGLERALSAPRRSYRARKGVSSITPLGLALIGGATDAN